MKSLWICHYQIFSHTHTQKWMTDFLSLFHCFRCCLFTQHNPHSSKIFPDSFWLDDGTQTCSCWMWKAEEENWLVSENRCEWTWNFACAFISGSWDHWQFLPATTKWTRNPMEDAHFKARDNFQPCSLYCTIISCSKASSYLDSLHWSQFSQLNRC